MDLANPGDLNSTPFHYLDKHQRGFLIDYTALEHLSGWEFDNVVIGGGGMPDRFADSVLNFLSNQTVKNAVIWGAGWEIDNPVLDQLAGSAQLVGIREWLPGTMYENQWVPCVSVLHPSIEKNLSVIPTKNFLVIDHWKRTPIELDGLAHARISNRSVTMDNVIQAIAEHRWIITSSYHGAYWATLLNKRVIFVSDPWMAKCANLKHSVPQAEKFSLDLLDQTQKYPDAYQECRQANLDFKEKFLQLWV